MHHTEENQVSTLL